MFLLCRFWVLHLDIIVFRHGGVLFDGVVMEGGGCKNERGGRREAARCVLRGVEEGHIASAIHLPVDVLLMEGQGSNALPKTLAYAVTRDLVTHDLVTCDVVTCDVVTRDLVTQDPVTGLVLGTAAQRILVLVPCAYGAVSMELF